MDAFDGMGRKGGRISCNMCHCADTVVIDIDDVYAAPVRAGPYFRISFSHAEHNIVAEIRVVRPVFPKQLTIL